MCIHVKYFQSVSSIPRSSERDFLHTLLYQSIHALFVDSLDDVSFSKFQYHSLTHTIFEMIQLKMSRRT